MEKLNKNRIWETPENSQAPEKNKFAFLLATLPKSNSHLAIASVETTSVISHQSSVISFTGHCVLVTAH